MGLTEVVSLVLAAFLISQTGPDGQKSPDPTQAAAEQPVDPTVQQIRRWLPRAVRKGSYPHLVKRVYEARGGGPLFFDGLTPTPLAHALLAMVENLEQHGLDRAPYRLGFKADTPHTHDKRAMKRQKKAKNKPVVLTTAKNAKQAASVDARLTGALVRYILEFGYIRRAHPSAPTRSVARIRNRQGTEIVAQVGRALENLEPELGRIWPKTPLYARLMKGLAYYRSLAGKKQPKVSYKAWKRATKKARASGKVVEQLQKRLAFEGFYSGEVNGELDAATEAAVADFNAAHGLADDSGVTWSTIRAMNQRVHSKVDRIRVSLQRLRESEPLRLGQQTYARINIPAFQMDVFIEGQLDRSHRVIVGNNRLDFNRFEWKQGYLNRTPMLETHVKKVILNPAWIPPPRILDEEFDGADRVIVPPGKKNPLGYVKFMLDRTNAVFMHDTNKRKLFGKHKRAFSHGCIRVHEALDLAQYVLEKFADVDKAKYDELFATGQQTPIPLTKELRVFVEYVTVVADDKDRLVFLKDVYHYDRDWLAGKTPSPTARYGANRLRPKGVPQISHADYQQLKGDKAPTEWPPAGTEEPAPTLPESTPL